MIPGRHGRAATFVVMTCRKGMRESCCHLSKMMKYRHFAVKVGKVCVGAKFFLEVFGMYVIFVSHRLLRFKYRFRWVAGAVFALQCFDGSVG
ncbi:hypothetical protein Sfum_1726 [Syntrophobacter fumaroxidans MPOB]|uniref:Uncharacterized protein n=1 Tax=Syntrophobacter fumaroxidans (strain DSM 10017 / MPOB) TaxID=335543 RepID=A0LJ11_SYNFM|nr:hypothetical protein Sfum_1726 [Syntrophobacter fumaroxidans MPOB]